MSILRRHTSGVLRPAEERDWTWCTSQNGELTSSNIKCSPLSARRVCRLARIAGAHFAYCLRNTQLLILGRRDKVRCDGERCALYDILSLPLN